MHQILLYLHSWNRWLLLFLGFLFLVVSFYYKNNTVQKRSENILRLGYLIALDVQFLLGLLLYAIYSPEVKTAFADLTFAMKSGVLRFFALEHFFMAVLAMLFLHTGNYLSAKEENPIKARSLRLIFFSVAYLWVILTIPWPFREEIARPLWRF
ncbi:MAG: hypothetical protein NZM25_04745 [Leptospiraceae bacterium]|nr:hypothetical protein [Leptospiraceae bacterium]